MLFVIGWWNLLLLMDNFLNTLHLAPGQAPGPNGQECLPE